ncbi:MAG: metalloregulator ArsR/SmtB family transcription factor [Desulfovibrio sp.]|nr:metalloregulator ArsR/SmtB family transcription factor [Desulfovibrio sp.]
MAKIESHEAATDCQILHPDIVDYVRERLPETSVSLHLANLFKLFADQTRIRLLQCLLTHEMCVCDIAATLGVTKSAVSHHLQALKLSNIVRFRREGQVIFYSLADEHVEKIVSMGLEHILEPAS